MFDSYFQRRLNEILRNSVRFTSPAVDVTGATRYTPAVSNIPIQYGGWSVLTATSLSQWGACPAINETDVTSTIGLSAEGMYFEQTTGATTGNQAGCLAANWLWSLEARATFIYKFSINQVSNIKFFIGAGESASLTTYGDADRPNLSHVGISFNTDVSDSTFKVSSDADAGASPSVIDLGVAPVADTVYYAILDGSNGATWNIYWLSADLEEIASALDITDTPTASTPLSPVIYTQTRADSAASHRTYFCHMSMLGAAWPGI